MKQKWIGCVASVLAALLAASPTLATPGGSAANAVTVRAPPQPPRRVPAPVIVRGLDGQANLRVNPGRPLTGYPLTRRGPIAPPEKVPLPSIEKVRLDARRVWLASSLFPEAKLARLVSIVRSRFPDSPNAFARYRSISTKQQTQTGYVTLSKLVAERAGVCRERSFLLSSVLDELGLRAPVRYGELYTDKGEYLGGHAWVEVSLDDKTSYLIDASAANPLARPTAVPVEQSLPDGTVRSVIGAQTPGYLYVPTNDLTFVRN